MAGRLGARDYDAYRAFTFAATSEPGKGRSTAEWEPSAASACPAAVAHRYASTPSAQGPRASRALQHGLRQRPALPRRQPTATRWKTADWVKADGQWKIAAETVLAPWPARMRGRFARHFAGETGRRSASHFSPAATGCRGM